MLDLTDMLDEIENAQEPTTLKSGSEHKLRIISVRGGTAGVGDCEYISPVFEVPAEPLAKEFSTFLWIPDKERLSEKQYARALSDFKKFVKAFNIDISKPLDYEDDLPGHEGWAILGTKNSDEYGEQNTVRTFITGR
jgi:hypothetical protein